MLLQRISCVFIVGLMATVLPMTAISKGKPSGIKPIFTNATKGTLKPPKKSVHLLKPPTPVLVPRKPVPAWAPGRIPPGVKAPPGGGNQPPKKLTPIFNGASGAK